MLADACSSHTRMWANKLSRNNVRVVVFSMSDIGKQTYDEHIKVYSVNILKFDSLKMLVSIIVGNILSLIFRPDIVHAHFLTRYGVLANFVFRRVLVSSAWGSDVYFLDKRHWLLKKLVSRCLNKSVLVLSSSRSLDAVVSKFTSTRRVVIPFGVEACCPVSEIVDSERVFIGCFKALKSVYGIDKLISAFAIARPDIKLEAQLIIAGEGEQRDELETLIKTEKLSGSVELFGELPHADILSLHKNCTIEVYPSKSEALGVSILEAMACGIPVIASSVGGIPEIISHGNNGLLVDVNITPEKLATEIVHLCNSQALQNRIGEHARKTIENDYSIDGCVQKLIEEYTKLI